MQAFLHAVRDYREQTADEDAAPPKAREGARLKRYDEPLPRLAAGGYDKYLFGHIGGTLGRHFAAAMRGRGMDADYVGRRTQPRCARPRRPARARSACRTS